MRAVYSDSQKLSRHFPFLNSAPIKMLAFFRTCYPAPQCDRRTEENCSAVHSQKMAIDLSGAFDFRCCFALPTALVDCTAYLTLNLTLAWQGCRRQSFEDVPSSAFLPLAVGLVMCSSVPPHLYVELRTTAIDSVSIWKGISSINVTAQSCCCFDILSFRNLIH